jgi:hypothetical protein
MLLLLYLRAERGNATPNNRDASGISTNRNRTVQITANHMARKGAIYSYLQQYRLVYFLAKQVLVLPQPHDRFVHVRPEPATAGEAGVNTC